MKNNLALIIIVLSWVATPATTQARPHAVASGLAAAADSALTAGSNPAGMTRFDAPSYQAEIFGFFSDSRWKEALSNSGQQRSTDSSSETVIPFAAMVRPINDKFVFGFTILGAGFSDDLGDWPGKYFMESYDALNISAFPSLAYRVNEKLSIAGSLSLTYASFEQERVVSNLLDPGTSEGSARLETDGLDVGFGLSMLYEVNERTRWGLAYHSEMDPTLDGEVSYSGLGPNTTAVLDKGGFVGAKIDVESRTPESLLVGLYHEFNNGHAITVDLAWSHFSRFKLSELYFDGEGLANNEAAYEDIVALSAGYSWALSNRWSMSVAALYVDDMVENKQRTMTLRLDSLWSVGAAAEWQWTEKRAIQIGLSYISLGDAPVTTPEIPGLGSLSGEYTSRELVFLRVGMSVGAL